MTKQIWLNLPVSQWMILFWNAYFGMFLNKFGIHWMINFDENLQK